MSSRLFVSATSAAHEARGGLAVRLRDLSEALARRESAPQLRLRDPQIGRDRLRTRGEQASVMLEAVPETEMQPVPEGRAFPLTRSVMNCCVLARIAFS